MDGTICAITKHRYSDLISGKCTIPSRERERGIATVRTCGIRSSNGSAFTQWLPVKKRPAVFYLRHQGHPPTPCKWRSLCFHEPDIPQLSARSRIKLTVNDEEANTNENTCSASATNVLQNMSKGDDEGARSTLYSVVANMFKLIVKEIYLSYKFFSYDLASTVLPGALMNIVSHMKLRYMFGSNTMSAPLWVSLVCSISWMWLFVYAVTLANQTQSARNGSEDITNKPSRPIPSGMVTINAAFWRLGLVCTAFILYSKCLSIGLLSVTWVGGVLVLNFMEASRSSLHWPSCIPSVPQSTV
ncbi:hypothetical protein KP509_1Z262900 [Ceratopteris richardii]|nr:hypothetical protein KP509_1Z262900 [Ceratopteris richardii]